MSTVMGVLPEKRSAEATSEAVKRSRIAQTPEIEGKVFGDDHKDSGEDDLDSDSYDGMEFDPPGSLAGFTDEDIPESPKLDTRGGQQETKGLLPTWVTFYCGICEEMTGHKSSECPYRCVARYQDDDRCFKKIHNTGDHFFRTLAETSSDDGF